ncbi:MAG: hypothetical protein HYZ94_00925 [Candidatus Omnitrophica bacterium]|nr:hypothetical protein [Candidatus Omnitrophota bacterium]
MKRAQIYLDDEVYEAVRTAAFQRRTSISSLLQQWARERTLGAPKKKRYAAGLLELAKQLNLHDTAHDVSERHDDYAWGEDT